jgi:hypothetical protein
MGIAVLGLVVGVYGCVASIAIHRVAFGSAGTAARLPKILAQFGALIVAFALAGWASITFHLGDLPLLAVLLASLSTLIYRRGRPRTPDQDAIKVALETPSGTKVARVVATGGVLLVVVAGMLFGLLQASH